MPQSSWEPGTTQPSQTLHEGTQSEARRRLDRRLRRTLGSRVGQLLDSSLCNMQPELRSLKLSTYQRSVHPSNLERNWPWTHSHPLSSTPFANHPASLIVWMSGTSLTAAFILGTFLECVMYDEHLVPGHSHKNFCAEVGPTV